MSAIRAGGEGDVTETHVLWQADLGLPDTCSPLVTDEFVLPTLIEGGRAIAAGLAVGFLIGSFF